MSIDPGPEQSAYVRMDDDAVVCFDIVPNLAMIAVIRGYASMFDSPRLVIEKIANMGQAAVGQEIFETAVWTGRFMEAFESIAPELKAHRIPRMPVKVHLCGSARAKDANIRQALIDRFGGSASIRRAKKGTKKEAAVEAGMLAGISSHVWSALAVACVYADKIRIGEFV